VQWSRSQGKGTGSVYEWVVNFEKGSVMPHLNVTFEKRPEGYEEPGRRGFLAERRTSAKALWWECASCI